MQMHVTRNNEVRRYLKKYLFYTFLVLGATYPKFLSFCRLQDSGTIKSSEYISC